MTIFTFFDPWPYVESTPITVWMEDTSIGGLISDSQDVFRQMALAYYLHEHVSEVQTGADVLRAAMDCMRYSIPVPPWLVIKLDKRYRQVTEFKVASFDALEAFGPLPDFPNGAKTRKTAALRAQYGTRLEILFDKKQVNLPRTPRGYAQAALLTGLTVQQVKDNLPLTRRHRSKPKIERPSERAYEYANPFGL